MAYRAIVAGEPPLKPLTMNVEEQTKYYESLLDTAIRQRDHTKRHEITSKYIGEALKTLKIGEQEARPFAPFRWRLSAIQTVTPIQLALLLALSCVLSLSLLFFSTPMLVTLIAAVTVFYLGDLLFNLVIAMRMLGHVPVATMDDAAIRALTGIDWPRYTILCPLYKEKEIVPQFVDAMQDLDYPANRLQILFLTEEDDKETRLALRAMHLPPHFTIVTVPKGEPRTKPRACNYGLLLATGDYVVIYDAEDIPDPLQLKKAVLTFAMHGTELACVQARLNYYNPEQNILTRWFTAEYSVWFDLLLPGLEWAGFPLPLGGTSNHFRLERLLQIGAWDAFNVTEDCDLGLRLARHQLKTVVMDSTTYEEANSDFKNWLRQRSRWIKGYMQTYLVHMREPWRYLQPECWRELLALQVVTGGKTLVLFINPLMWAILLLYLLFRAVVTPAYHVLFPLPVLYMGTLCLIFGNFFYIYIHVLGCLRRRQYRLIKWSMLIPLYWAMSSIAATIALYQLLYKPHYWEKTLHGLHLRKQSKPVTLTHCTIVTAEHEAVTLPKLLPPARQTAQTKETNSSTNPKQDVLVQPEVTPQTTRTGPRRAGTAHMFGDTVKRITLIKTLPTPTVRVQHTIHNEALQSLKVRIQSRQAAIQNIRYTNKLLSLCIADLWLSATVLITCAASVLALLYYMSQHQILLYGDAYSHMLIARRLFDNATPGLAQLGGVWLPLPHLLMVPFIWNDYLWHTGLAGSFVSMPCYTSAAIYLYLAARRLTHNRPASFIGTLLFILNPSVLYLQTTPLTEPVLIATFTIAGYYFLAWAQDDQPTQLIAAAACTFLATLARYDGWFLFAVMLGCIPLIGLLKRHGWARIEGNLLTFGSLGGLGILLWFLWCWAIFGDLLYFQRGPFSSQAQQMQLLKIHMLYTYHSLWQSLRAYTLSSLETVGPLLFILAVFGIILLIVRRKFSADMLAGLAFLAPFAFYVIALYGGQAALFVPGSTAPHSAYQFYNSRYGVQVVVPVALFVAILASSGRQITRSRQIVQIILVAAIVLQSYLVASSGIIALQDGLYGVDCVPTHSIIVYLAQHYNGGRIMEDTYTAQTNALGSEAYIDFKNMVYEGSGQLWNVALQRPASVVDWIIVNPQEPNDLVAQQIQASKGAFLSQFTLLLHESDGLNLYHRNGLPPLPTRPVSSSVLTAHRLCRPSGPLGFILKEGNA